MTSDLCPKAETTNAAHCWHVTNRSWLTSPPQRVHVCCRCGNEKGEAAVIFTTPRDPSHGPFQP